MSHMAEYRTLQIAFRQCFSLSVLRIVVNGSNDLLHQLHPAKFEDAVFVARPDGGFLIE